MNGMEQRTLLQRTGVALGSIAAGLALMAAPVAAQTYTDGSGGSTGVEVDNPTTGGGGNSGANNGVTDGAVGGGSGGQTGDELAFTGGDALGLAAIGGVVVGAGAVMVAVGRRNNDDD